MVECDPACDAGFTCVDGACVAEGACAATGDIANLRSCVHGNVDVTLEAVTVTVTYIHANGYFLQDASAAIHVYEGAGWPGGTLVVGDVIDLHVTSYGAYNGMQQVNGHDDPVVITEGSGDSGFVLDVSAGILPTEENEGHVITGTGFTAVTVDGRSVTVDYGTATDVILRLNVDSTLCPGATFDLAAGVITQWLDDHRFQVFDVDTEITNIDTAGCEVVECDPACGDGHERVDGVCVELPPLCDPACDEGFTCMGGFCVADGDCLATGDIANLQTCPETDVDVNLTGVTVTYVFPRGYFVQDASGAMLVWVGYEWAFDAPTVGQVVDVPVTAYGSHAGQQEVKGSGAPVVVGSADAEALKLDFAAGTVPSEDYESYVVELVGATVDSLGASTLSISYGSASGVIVHIDDVGALCVGATFDILRAPVTQFETIHQLEVYDAAADITNIDTSACVVVEHDDSNWGFEESDQQDPPADFEKASLEFTANVVSDPVFSGSGACELTWTSTSNQNFYQGMYVPVTGSQMVTFSVYALDQDPGGRVRAAMTFYDADENSLGTEYGGYSQDGDDWSGLMANFEAPANAAFVRAFVRMYDSGDSWTGQATVYIDEWTLTVSGVAAHDDSNWGFEEDVQQDPPADFEKANTDFTASVVSDPVHDGGGACELTWTSTSNQDFFQGMYVPVTTGQTVTFSFFALDEDPGGRVRAAMTFYDAAGDSLGAEYGGYTQDDAAWAEVTTRFTAPGDAAFVRAFVRMYDDSENWTGQATVYIDDWTLAVD